VNRCIKLSGNEAASWGRVIEQLGGESASILRRMILGQLDALSAIIGFDQTTAKKDSLSLSKQSVDKAECEKGVEEDSSSPDCNVRMMLIRTFRR
jgi:hypothetical protein